jgi:3-oxoacyl-[acyl-carrier protein] reductase
MDLGLTGKACIVTGATRGIGLATVRMLVDEGARVLLVARDRDEFARVADDLGGCEILAADVTDAGDDERIVAACAERFGAVDVLVNNAAVYPRRAWTEIAEEEWDSVLATNLKGYFLCARAAYPSMRERGRGRIINVTSITFFVGSALLLDYVSSKGAVVGFTRALAREVGPEGVTVNAIAPGAFPTDAEKIHPNPEEYNQWVLDQQSLKRRGTPEDIGNLTVFLASDASSFITGQTIGINGGWAMH